MLRVEELKEMKYADGGGDDDASIRRALNLPGVGLVSAYLLGGVVATSMYVSPFSCQHRELFIARTFLLELFAGGMPPAQDGRAKSTVCDC